MGVAIVIVNHLRTAATLLHEILPRYTKMPVELITEKLLIQPNRVFIIPAQRDLHVLDGEFRLTPISKPRGWPDVITVFLRSLIQHSAPSVESNFKKILRFWRPTVRPCRNFSFRWECGSPHQQRLRQTAQPYFPA
jgi:hypothetical protein